MRSGRWFLPETPDVVGMLRRQCEATIAGLDGFARWAEGEHGAATALEDAERHANEVRRELLGALRAAFVTPLDPEDVYALSRSIDRVLSAAREVVVEAEVLAAEPEPGIAEMAGGIREAMGHLDRAIGDLGEDPDGATAAAQEVFASERRLHDSYYRGMAALLEAHGRTTRIASRELYRRCLRIGEHLVDAAARVVYAVVKQS
jgi:uncharacterized protein Yka (UPF0111/DUF47 family)